MEDNLSGGGEACSGGSGEFNVDRTHKKQKPNSSEGLASN